jgi:Ca2+-binding RTX toxin-like protein
VRSDGTRASNSNTQGGKGRIQDLFFGSADLNTLCLTDGENGDALFADDVYTDSPENMAEDMARLFRIREIFAGAGDDIVDMTSQRFEYVGDGLTIKGGDGSDGLWANKGDNLLFGDAGNDRIIGADGNDVIVGGIGNDRMHGGGDDIFTFCEEWGADTVEQLADGSVTLWFVSGSEENWNAETLTYTDGGNSVNVSGVAADAVTLKFGYDYSDLFLDLDDIGAFDDFTSERIFEDKIGGTLAVL